MREYCVGQFFLSITKVCNALYVVACMEHTTYIVNYFLMLMHWDMTIASEEKDALRTLCGE